MNNFIYENKTKVFFGRGCVKEFLTCLVKDYDTIMMGYGQGSAKRNGIYDEVLGILMREGKTVVEFSGIMPNPTYKKVMEGVKLARAHQVQMILGIGGGSVMDCCKAVALAARYKGDAWGNFWDRKGIVDFEPIPVGVIPTTAGTGSECNGAAVITNEEEKVKIGYDYPKCNPEFALMDPAYTFSVPREQMVSGAFPSCHDGCSAFVIGIDMHIFVGQVVGPYGRLGIASVQVDVDMHLPRRHVHLGPVAAGLAAVADAHAVDVHGHPVRVVRRHGFGNRAQGADDAAPVRIVARDRALEQVRCGHGAPAGQCGVLAGRAGDGDPHVMAGALAVADDLAGERGAGFQPQQNSNPFQSAPAPSAAAGDGFMNIPDGIDEELPFN